MQDFLMNWLLIGLHFLPYAAVASGITVGLFLLLRRYFGRLMPFTKAVFRRVPVGDVTGEDSEAGHGTQTMQRVLGWPQLTIMGIAAIIGTGIFVLPGQAAALHAGPAVILSFVLCFFLCVIVALCYAEFASMIRSSGSAFMYAYATLGEIIAWVIGWDLLLEYAFGASGVAVGWSAYFKSITENLFGRGHFADESAGTISLAFLGVAAAVGVTFLVRSLLLRLTGKLVQAYNAGPSLLQRLKLGSVERLWAQYAPWWIQAPCAWTVNALKATVAWSWNALMTALPFLVGFIGIGLVGIPERFTHAPKEVPWLILGLAGTIVLGLLYLRTRLNPTLLGWNNFLGRRLAALVKWSPLGVGIAVIAILPSVDLPAILIVLAVSQLLVRGVHHTAQASTIFVVIKLVVIIVFVLLGLGHIDPSNWIPFIPARAMVTPPGSTVSHLAFGWQGIVTGAAILLFAFIGFDGVSTAAAECKRPQRDVPIGILLSLALCTVAYIAMAVVMTGCMHYSQLGGDETTGAAPIALIMKHIGLEKYSWIISAGAIAGITSALILSLYGQSRVQWSLANRGLVPPFMAQLHPKYGTPANAIQVWGWIAATVAGVFTISELSELTNIGTLAAFVLVMIGLCVLRITEPNRERGFRCPSLVQMLVNFVVRGIFRRKSFNCPWLPDLPLLGSIGCIAFMWALPEITKIRFVVWMVLGVAVYFMYSFWNSKLRTKPQVPPTSGDAPKLDITPKQEPPANNGDNNNNK
jgi:amino acid transporter